MHLVKPAPAPDTPESRSRGRIRAMTKPAGMLECPRCGGREVIETRIGATDRGGGTKIKLCAACFMRGERVVIR